MERIELLEAALDSLPDGLAVLGRGGETAYWNQAAEAITGFAAIDLLGRPVPEALKSMVNGEPAVEPEAEDSNSAGRWQMLQLRHKLGHAVPVIGLELILRDGLGSRIGRAVLFHPAERLDALPHGEAGDNRVIAASQQELEERLQSKFEDFLDGGSPFGVLWIGVDQASELRRTHGAGACEAMLAKVEHALQQGLRPVDEMGRWGTDEFLVIAHERTAEMLGAHAKTLAGLARTADFRWWGDRVQLTVSIGVSQAERDETGRGGIQTLAQLLSRAQEGMEASVHAGGNCITPPPGGKTCLPSSASSSYSEQ
jgi:diguanylate cyclase (GGDEF)-like protein/PAS domain S-box-containing protein